MKYGLLYSGPPAPHNITISSNNPTELDVKWNDRCDVVNKFTRCGNSHLADIYTIRYRPAGGTELTKIVGDGGDPKIVPPRQTTLKNLVSNAEYTITIQIEGHGGKYKVFSDVSEPKTGLTSELRLNYRQSYNNFLKSF